MYVAIAGTFVGGAASALFFHRPQLNPAQAGIRGTLTQTVLVAISYFAGKASSDYFNPKNEANNDTAARAKFYTDIAVYITYTVGGATSIVAAKYLFNTPYLESAANLTGSLLAGVVGTLF